MKRKTIKNLIDLKKSGEPIVCLTAYTFPQAQILDEHCDLLLVGDSLGMVIYGHDSTLPVTIDVMINHGRAVVKGSQKAFVAVDMPFGSYQKSKEQAYENCSRVLAETGAQAIKLEGGTEIAGTIKHLVDLGIPVLGHIGMKPQYHNVYGGFSVQGKDEKSHNKVLDDALAIKEAGVFATVLEAVTEETAKAVCKTIDIPVIGIGASAQCDGQVLVIDDVTGLSDKTPKFVKKYADIRSDVIKAAKAYASDVKSRKFPGKDNIY